jgi:uncharacterized membrane protein
MWWQIRAESMVLLHGAGGDLDELACVGVPVLIIVGVWFLTRRRGDGGEDGPTRHEG